MNYQELFNLEVARTNNYVSSLVDQKVIEDFYMGSEYLGGAGKVWINLVRNQTAFQVEVIVGDKNVMKLVGMVRELIRNTLVL